jgi:hypothetical protein
MKEKIVHIPELHNNNYGFFDVLAGLCKSNINKEFCIYRYFKIYKTRIEG